MKALLIVCLLGLAVAYHKFNFLNEGDMLEYMRDEDHRIYVLYFYNGNPTHSAVGEELRQRNDDE